MAELPLDSFLASYQDDTSVRFDEADLEMTLGSALAMERAFCKADTARRTDPVKRLGYLATILAAAGTLRPEHQYLLPTAEI